MKSRLITLLILSSLLQTIVKAQYPALQRSIGFGSPIFATDMLLCNNSSLLIVGYDSLATSRSIILINLDTVGNIVWQRKLSNSATLRFESIKALQTSDNGFCLVGKYIFPNGDTTIGLFKTNSTGQALWDLQLKPLSGGYNDAALDVRESPDGNLYVSGYYYPFASTQPYPWFAKVHASGQLEWIKKLNVAGGEAVRTNVVSNTQIVLGINETGNMRHPIIAFLDSSGTLTQANRIHRFNYTDAELVDLYADSFQQIVSLNIYDSLGNVFLAHCRTTSQGSLFTSDEVYFAGHKLKIKKCLEPNNFLAFSLLELSDTTASTMIGATDGFVPFFDNWLIDTIYHSLPVGLQYTGDVYTQSLYVSGNIPYSSTQSGILFTKTCYPLYNRVLPCNGMYLTTFQLYEDWTDSLYLFSVTDITASILVTNPVLTSATTSYVATTICNTTGVEENKSVDDWKLFPNPSNGNFQLNGNFPSNSQLHLYNLVGQEVADPISLPEGNQKVPIELNLADGIYIYRIISEGEILYEGKLIIVR